MTGPPQERPRKKDVRWNRLLAERQHARRGWKDSLIARLGPDDGDEALLEPRNMVLRTGKQNRPKTAVKGKRYHCAMCRKRSPRPVKTPAPWYCPNCLKQMEQAAIPDTE
jgi:hypothetical protein